MWVHCELSKRAGDCHLGLWRDMLGKQQVAFSHFYQTVSATRKKPFTDLECPLPDLEESGETRLPPRRLRGPVQPLDVRPGGRAKYEKRRHGPDIVLRWGHSVWPRKLRVGSQGRDQGTCFEIKGQKKFKSKFVFQARNSPCERKTRCPGCSCPRLPYLRTYLNTN